MNNLDIKIELVPSKLKAFAKNEVYMNLILRNMSDVETFWCECDVNMAPPLSLSHDSEMNNGRTRIGILKPKGMGKKQVKLYTRPNNYPDEYTLNLIAYIYDEEGAISERLEQKVSIACVGDEVVKNVQDK